MIILSINIGTTNARAQRTKFVFRKRNYRTCIYTPQQCNLKRAQFLHNNTLADIIRAINHLIISCVYIIIVLLFFFSAVGNSEKKNNGRTHLIDIHVVIIIIIFFRGVYSKYKKQKIKKRRRCVTTII